MPPFIIVFRFSFFSWHSFNLYMNSEHITANSNSSSIQLADQQCLAYWVHGSQCGVSLVWVDFLHVCNIRSSYRVLYGTCRYTCGKGEKIQAKYRSFEQILFSIHTLARIHKSPHRLILIQSTVICLHWLFARACMVSRIMRSKINIDVDIWWAHDKFTSLPAEKSGKKVVVTCNDNVKTNKKLC